jgi:hypothetical protein
MIVILWILAVLSFIFFITKYLLPFIIEKIIWFKMNFVSFGKDKSGNPTCTCYGESISLGLKSDEEDTKLARIQFGFLDINY